MNPNPSNEEAQQVLADALAKNAAKAGQAGGAIGGAIGGGLAGAAGGIVGGEQLKSSKIFKKSVIRFNKTVKAEKSLSLSGLDVTSVESKLDTYFSKGNKSPDSNDRASSIYQTVTGLDNIMANPALVTAHLQKTTNQLVVRGYAQEGLIKQKTAEKEVDKLVAFIGS